MPWSGDDDVIGTSGPELDWQDGHPVSRRFGDVYFSRDSGIEETRHVFLAGNRLEARWAALPAGARFTIGETGFGTGLNFCAAWQLWARVAPRDSVLRYVSVERFPVASDELARALAMWPELAPYAGALAAQYAEFAPGWHRFHFAASRVILTLAIGDAATMLGSLAGSCDAWFLDGFAPAKNPEMWTQDVMAAVGTHSRAGATVATYSVAAAVRERLQAAGFTVAKTKGFGRKREMLSGTRETPAAPACAVPERRAVVIGGGLAGAASAWSLAVRGWKVTLLERAAALAQGASGNPQGVLYARLAARASPLGEFVLGGYAHSLRLLNASLPQGEETWRACGVLQLALDAKTAERHAAVIDAGLAAGGLFFPDGGWVNPGAFVNALAAHPRIEVRTQTDASTLERAASGEWQARDANGVIAAAPVMLIATSADATRLGATRHLPLHAVRGQITRLAETPASRELHTVVCGEASITPAQGGLHTLGATFVHDFTGLDLSATEHRRNLADLAAMAPALATALEIDGVDPERLTGRAAVRCTSPDRLPLAGEVRHREHLCMSSAHGSRGLISAPLCGEVIAAILDDEPAPVASRLLAALSPARFDRPA
jgi:tRNA 5-methylaminomethyl-2-thiouridine biosynthesis bifunctional protein